MTGSDFQGSGWHFPPAFFGKGRLSRMAHGEEDIAQSLMILLATAPGERVMQPDYGCSLHAMTYETFDESTDTDVVDRVERAILFHEPRVSVNRVDVDLSRQEDGVLAITVDYTVRITNTRSNMVYPFYFLEGTNV